MNMTDPIADMLTRIRNGVRARLPKIDVPGSKLKAEIARILKDEGFIANFRLVDDGRQGTLRIFLKPCVRASKGLPTWQRRPWATCGACLRTRG